MISFNHAYHSLRIHEEQVLFRIVLHASLKRTGQLTLETL